MTDAKALAGRLRDLTGHATPGRWVAAKWGDGSSPEGFCNITVPDLEVTLASNLPDTDAALICELVNNLPAILSALEALPAPVSEGEVERDYVEIGARAFYEYDDNGLGVEKTPWADAPQTAGYLRRAFARAALAASRPSGEGRLREALEPFAKAADWADGWYTLPINPDAVVYGTNVTIGDLRRARAALSEQPETKEA